MTGRTLRRLAAVGLLAGLVAAPGVALADPAPSPTGKAFAVDDERVTESSGLAASNEHQGTYYTINDSDNQAYVFAIDGESGEVQAALRFRQIENRDWEAIAAGPDGRIWIGDIGDNERNQPSVTVYRFREPEQLEDQRMRYVSYRLEYPDGPHDAETLLVHPKTGRLYVVTKGLAGTAIYEAPEELSEEGTNELERYAGAPPAITDGAFVPDGSQMILRTYHAAFVYDWGSKPKLDHKIALPAQPQGESLAVSADGENVLVGSEGENSQVYAISLAAAAAATTPSPTAKPAASPSATAGAGAGSGASADKGTDNSLLAGVPWWVPVLVLVVALVAAVAAFPARRAPARIPQRPAPVPAGGPGYEEQTSTRAFYREEPPVSPPVPPPVPPPAPAARPLYRDDLDDFDREPQPAPPPPRQRRPLFRDEPPDDEPPLTDPYRQPDPYQRGPYRQPEPYDQESDPYARDPYGNEPDPWRVEPPVREPYRRED